MDPSILAGVDLENPEVMGEMANKILEKMRTEDKTLQELLGVSQGELEHIYELGYTYYNRGQYKEAASLFYFLSGISPLEHKYAFALGASLYLKGDDDLAILAFAKAKAIDEKDVLSPFYLGEIAMKIKSYEEAEAFFKEVVKRAGRKAEHKELKERAKLTLKKIASLS